MSEVITVDDCRDGDDLDIYDEKPSGKRWDPLGAPNDQDEFESPQHSALNPNNEQNELQYSQSERDRLQILEEEQEILTSSLFSLTSHFAQVQFRLRQIVDASPDDKESLLKALEEFAFRGVPEIGVHKELLSVECSNVENQRRRQQELIDQLKQQLEDLESYAYETGEAGLPQAVLLERQRVIIDELKSKINLNVDEMEQSTLSPDELRHQVDCAIGQLVSPLKMKETLVNQLKTQILDLERFINFLQGESDEVKKNVCTCKCSKHGHGSNKTATNYQSSSYDSHRCEESDEKIRAHTIGIMQKVAALLQIFATTQFGCGSDNFKKNKLKKTVRGNHWGDLRARLEMAVEEVLDIVKKSNSVKDELTAFGDYSSDSEDGPVMMFNVQLTTAVRKRLATSIRDLMQHGLMPIGQSTSLVPFFGCFPQRGQHNPAELHPWELILEYYHLKNGESYNSTPARRLSQSFNLNIVVGTPISNKQNLLGAIASVIADHSPYKRSYDTHFKAFICAALNANKLVQWLHLLFQCSQLVNMNYAAWSYVARTGFLDSLQSLDRLSKYKYDLPVDLAVRKFQNIKDVFM